MTLSCSRKWDTKPPPTNTLHGPWIGNQGPYSNHPTKVNFIRIGLNRTIFEMSSNLQMSFISPKKSVIGKLYFIQLACVCRPRRVLRFMNRIPGTNEASKAKVCIVHFLFFLLLALTFCSFIYEECSFRSVRGKHLSRIFDSLNLFSEVNPSLVSSSKVSETGIHISATILFKHHCRPPPSLSNGQRVFQRCTLYTAVTHNPPQLYT